MQIVATSYADAIAITVDADESIHDALVDALQDADLPVALASSVLAVQTEAAAELTDPATSVAFTTIASGVYHSAAVLDWTATAEADMIVYLGVPRPTQVRL